MVVILQRTRGALQALDSHEWRNPQWYALQE